MTLLPHEFKRHFKNKSLILDFAGIILIFLISVWVHRSLLGSMSDHLFDWNDYPLMVWVTDQHIDHFSRFDFKNFFHGNIFYPDSEKALLFSDLLLPTSVIGYFLSFFTPNRILIMNVLFFMTWFLNIVASWWLWKKYVSGYYLWLSTLATSMLPFLFLNTAHFQILNIWPLLLGFRWLLDNKIETKKAVLLGITSAFLFTSSVYLSIFFLWSIGTWIMSLLMTQKLNKTFLSRLFLWCIYFGLTFLSLAGVFIYQYIQVKNTHQISRSYQEYIQYSSSLSDYFSTKNYHSIFSKSDIGQVWNQQFTISSYSLFPTFSLLVLALFGICKLYKKKDENFSTTIFMTLIMLQGFIFSLGPRLKWNNEYIGFPLPYSVILKFIPLVEPIRGLSRWSLLFFIGLLYFVILGIKYISDLKISENKKNLLILFIGVTYLIEILPINRTAASGEIISDSNIFLQESCVENQQVLLEYPMTYNPFGDVRGIEVQLQNWSDMLISASGHDCVMINGYSGFFPPYYQQFERTVAESVASESCTSLRNALTAAEVDLVRLKYDKLTEDEVRILSQCFNTDEKREFGNEDHLQEIIFLEPIREVPFVTKGKRFE